MKLPNVPENIPTCNLTVMNAGFCKTKKTHLLKGEKQSDILVPALFFLIEHPVYGNILFDTGYSTRYFESTKAFPFSIMNKITPVEITEKENAVHQLKEKGITAKQINIVILSHLHADHAGGIADFNESTIYVAKEEWNFGKQSRLKLLFNGYLKQLYENIDSSHLELLDFARDGFSYGPFSHVIDLFEDGTILCIPLPGHSIGQFGLLLNISNEERYFLIADSVFVKDNYRKNRGGSFLSRLAHFNRKQYECNFPILQKVENNHPNLVVIPSHDPESYEQFIGEINEK